MISVPEEEGEEEKIRSPPTFVSKPEPVTVEEGECSRFCCRVTGYPKPRVMWVINGHTVVSVSLSIIFYSSKILFEKLHYLHYLFILTGFAIQIDL